MTRSFEKIDLQDCCLTAINNIPTSELKYYFLLAYHSIKDADADVYGDFLDELSVLSVKLNEFLNPENEAFPKELLSEIQQSYQKLCNFSKTNTLPTKVGYALINIGSVLLAVFTGVLGGIIGGLTGLTRGILSFSNPLQHLADGLITGFAFGSAVGFRAPKKLFKDELSRQLKFCLNQIDACMQEVQAQEAKPFSYYKEQVENRILNECFEDDNELYQEFLDNNQTFYIKALNARFVSKNLEGYLGHHACIVVPLPNKEEPELIEFALGQSDFKDRTITQEERREGTGATIVEMIALHQQLQVTQTCTYGYVLTKMKAGENDCMRYVEKILVGTGQETTSVRRFNGTENWVGKNIIGFFMQKLSPFRQDILPSEQPELH